ncbi:hypothetical protein SprV_0200588800 [Sparganum proliferum]
MLQTWQLKDVRYSFHVISDYKKKTAWMNSWHYATATSALRLYIPEILNDTQKVLSLDTDVILLDDISELWDFIHEADERQLYPARLLQHVSKQPVSGEQEQQLQEILRLKIVGVGFLDF